MKRLPLTLLCLALVALTSSQALAESSVSEGALYKGEVLLVESFADTKFHQRGWFDLRSNVTLTTSNPAPQMTQVLECEFLSGATVCTNGVPKRIVFEETEAVYLSYWVRYSPNYIGSNRSYHPHEFVLLTNKDEPLVGPANSHLSVNIEQVGGVPRIAMVDTQNIDTACILLNDDRFVGCNGDYATYQFTEKRSAAACNGILGELDLRDCYSTGPNSWYSARVWTADKKAFDSKPGPYFKADWHFVEAYVKLNDIVDGIGIPNGSIRYWFDGELLISSDEILFRTGQHPDMAFNSLMFEPYIGDGSPIRQWMWVGEITVAKGVMPQ